jgi:hypothetical protein
MTLVIEMRTFRRLPLSFDKPPITASCGAGQDERVESVEQPSVTFFTG